MADHSSAQSILHISLVVQLLIITVFGDFKLFPSDYRTIYRSSEIISIDWHATGELRSPLDYVAISEAKTTVSSGVCSLTPYFSVLFCIIVALNLFSQVYLKWAYETSGVIRNVVLPPTPGHYVIRYFQYIPLLRFFQSHPPIRSNSTDRSHTKAFGCPFSHHYNVVAEWEIVHQGCFAMIELSTHYQTGNLTEVLAFDGIDDHGITGLAPSFVLSSTMTLEVILFD